MTRLSILICMLAACGGGGDGDDSPTVDAMMNEPLVNGEPASQYYNRFTHQTTSTGVDGAAAFTMTQGRNAFLVTFFLLPNKELQLFYAEGEGEVTATGWALNIDTTTKKKRTGTWKVEGAQLVLDSVMRCDGMLFNDQPALRCTLTSPILTAAAKDRAGMFRKRISASSPTDSEFAGFTP